MFHAVTEATKSLIERIRPAECALDGEKLTQCQMRVFGTGVLGTRYCRVPGSWYRAEGCVGPDR